MGGWIYIGINILSILPECEETETLYSKWLVVGIVYMHDVPGDLWNDKVFAAGVPPSGVVLGRME